MKFSLYFGIDDTCGDPMGREEDWKTAVRWWLSVMRSIDDDDHKPVW
jgi:hypothetical protein